MRHLKINSLLEILKTTDLFIEEEHTLEVNHGYLQGKGEELLLQVFESLGGKGSPPVLERLKFDLKINRFLLIYDDEVHFNRYRLNTLKSDLYETFSFGWTETYKRLCRNYEKECLKTGLQDRIWNGPPLASKVFGKSETAGDLSGNGSAGWKLNAYNDAQYDLLTRLHGFKMIRISMYENLMVGGSLRKLDDLLLHPNEVTQLGIKNWLLRKLE